MGVIILAIGDSVGQNCSAAEVPGERRCSLAIRRKAAEERILEVVAEDLVAFLAVVLFEPSKALDNGNKCQSAGTACREQFTGQVLDHQAGHEILGGIRLRENQKNSISLPDKQLRIDAAVNAEPAILPCGQQEEAASAPGTDCLPAGRNSPCANPQCNDS